MAYDAQARPFHTTVVQALASGTQQYVTRTKYDKAFNSYKRRAGARPKPSEIFL